MHMKLSLLAAILLKAGRKALLLVVLPAIVGCTATSDVPVVERTQPPSKKVNHHWVAEGETLYAIAWRYNLDIEQLARVNRLDLREKIYVGQKLRLDVPDTGRIEKRRAIERTAYSPSAEKRKRNDSIWHWPTRGTVTKKFSYAGNVGHKGIAIKARKGQPVLASQKGVVVYAGSGLPAYGNLLIVKHPENYLSAYAHNSKLMVGEGTQVSVGQKIAEVGATGTNHEHLYFEIRKKGKPVNPMSLLKRAKG